MALTDKYDPRNSQHRAELGAAMVAVLTEQGFVQSQTSTGSELVYEGGKNLPERAGIRVFTSLVLQGGRPVARAVDADAIRVVGIWTGRDGKTWPVASAEARVFRVGTVAAIIDRTGQRVAGVRDAILEHGGCGRCGAIRVKGKSAVYCADKCWLDRQPSAQVQAERPPVPAVAVAANKPLTVAEVRPGLDFCVPGRPGAFKRAMDFAGWVLVGGRVTREKITFDPNTEVRIVI